MKPRLLVVGDSMLDCDVLGRAERLCAEAPVPVLDESAVRLAPGGAALAASLLARDGHEVTLLTALAHDEAGIALADLLAEAGVLTVNTGMRGTTHEKLRLRAGGQLVCRLDRGGGRPQALGDGVGRLVEDAEAVLVSDYGRGVCDDPTLAGALASAGALVWDPHPRGSGPRRGATLVTPNESEARQAAGGGRDAAEAAVHLRQRWAVRAVCVTCGDKGAVVADGTGPPLTITVDPVHGDPCGAGDRFAATATALVAAGVPLVETVEAAAAEARTFVEQSGWHGTVLPSSVESALDRTRARGGKVVATGGCFDLLHAGHVALLEAARRLGDCLVVCLNSDASVARLKGPDRPLVAQHDRAAVLRSLRSVDDVLLFDEDTPVEAIRRLRPDVWVKGADYDADELPEADVVRRLGGRVVTVPYVAGRSTTRLIERAGVGAR
ncbi:MAG TPA: D-glycero-beta-D-manno-heptose 1-phosphate adenylyltransferase [Gaiella sp.]|nr:D-glycero-beta-D-manno-heptose 1-phosphate adenylyltransferase [Gaiella sp.]